MSTVPLTAPRPRAGDDRRVRARRAGPLLRAWTGRRCSRSSWRRAQASACWCCRHCPTWRPGRCLEFGASDYVSKPLPGELVARIRREFDSRIRTEQRLLHVRGVTLDHAAGRRCAPAREHQRARVPPAGASDAEGRRGLSTRMPPRRRVGYMFDPAARRRCWSGDCGEAEPMSSRRCGCRISLRRCVVGDRGRVATFAAVNVVVILTLSDSETIPFDFVWVSLARLRFRVWRLRTTMILLLVAIAVTAPRSPGPSRGRRATRPAGGGPAHGGDVRGDGVARPPETGCDREGEATRRIRASSARGSTRVRSGIPPTSCAPRSRSPGVMPS